MCKSQIFKYLSEYVQYSSDQFSSRWCLHSLECRHGLHPISQKCPRFCLSNASNFGLIDKAPILSLHPLKAESRLSRFLCVCVFSLRLLPEATDDLISFAVCLKVASQVPKYVSSSETRTTCDGCFVGQSICLVISLDSSMSWTVYLQVCFNDVVEFL